MRDQFAVFQKRKANLKKDHLQEWPGEDEGYRYVFFYQGILTIFGD